MPQAEESLGPWPWIVSLRSNASKSVKGTAVTRYEAMLRGARKLGVTIDRVDACVDHVALDGRAATVEPVAAQKEQAA